MAEVQVASHPAVFTTKTPHVLPAQKYLIPATWRRYQLSQLVNKVLSLPQSIPFDFLIRGEVVRTSIGEWCTEHDIGEEETLEIEYIESLMPPQRMAAIPQEDWISSVSCQAPGRILAASYDAHVHLFDALQTPIYTIPGHTGPVTSVCWVGGERLMASASQDCTARLVQMPQEGQPTALASLHLHTAPLSSVASDKDGKFLMTASWDTLIGIWDTSTPETDQTVAEEVDDRKKRRKVAQGDRPVRKAPEAVMRSHTGRISRALFSPLVSSQNIAYSCGLDSTIRTWDTSLGICTSTISLSEKPLMDLAILADGGTIAVASTDRTVAAYDVRRPTTLTLPAVSFTHAALPSTVAAHPADERRILSGSYDGTVRVWDLRSPKAAVAVFRTEKGGKVLSVDWGAGACALGGENGVEVWKVGENGEQAQ